jgi:hypothetical protein
MQYKVKAPRSPEALVPAILQGDTSQARAIFGFLFQCMFGGDRNTVVTRCLAHRKSGAKLHGMETKNMGIK